MRILIKITKVLINLIRINKLGIFTHINNAEKAKLGKMAQMKVQYMQGKCKLTN